MDSIPIPNLDLDFIVGDDLGDEFGIGDLTRIQTNYQAPLDLPRRKLLRPVEGEPNNYIMEIDNSSLEQFIVCHKSSENYLIHAREIAQPAAALSFGTAIHKALDVRFRYGLNASSEQRMFEEIYQHFVKFPQPPEEYRTADRAIQEIKRYNKMYPDPDVFTVAIDENDEPMVEMPFNFPFFTVEMNKEVPYSAKELVQGADGVLHVSDAPTLYIGRVYVVWTGRIDAIVKMDKFVWVVDHKTTSIGGENYYKDFVLASQMRGYTWAAKQLTGLPIYGLYLNSMVVRAPTKTGTASELKRQQYPYRQDQIDEWVEDTQELILTFLNALGRGKFPQEPKWCFGKYGKCQYHDACTAPKKDRKEILGSHAYRDVTWSPLLERQ